MKGRKLNKKKKIKERFFYFILFYFLLKSNTFSSFSLKYDEY